MNYFQGIWESRYFWIHLALSDLRAKWRRSFLGMFWSIVQPLGMTSLLAIVFSRIFNTDIADYAPYILSGMIIWEFLTTTTIGGSLAFVQADAYIKQCRHPLAIYTLRTVLTNLIVLSLASIALLGWVLIAMPYNFGWSWLAALQIFPILILITWPLTTVLAYIGVRFRDVPQVLGLVLQVLWFISPVYFEAKVFKAGHLSPLVDYNPIFHLMEIVRAPLLRGQWPTWENITYCLVMVVILSLIAWGVGQRAEQRVIFYL